MHYFGAAVAPSDTTRELAEKVIDPILAPHQEWQKSEDDYGGVWDWYVVGGRWTGEWATYDPWEDPDNQEICRTCNGTGERPGGKEQFGAEWYVWCHGCNGCSGTGTHVKFAPDFKPCTDDVLSVKQFLSGEYRLPYTLFLPGGEVLQKETFETDNVIDPKWLIAVRNALKPYLDEMLVIVDYHC
jgi:hypothetical protein